MQGWKLFSTVALLAVSAATSAATITVNWNPGAFSPAGVNVGTVHFPVAQTTGADAGRFEGTVTASDVDPATLYASTSDFYAYCFDLAQTLQSGTTYTVLAGAPTAVLDFLGAANAYFGGNAYRWLDPANSSEAAAVQLGIWEALHNDDFALTTGDVRFGSVNATIADLFNGIAALRGTTADLDAQLVMRLHSASTQDVITGVRPPRRVPEPGTLLLIGIGAAAAFARRRRG
jgi:hypothetical protein